MNPIVDPRILVPDEVEHLAQSGYDAATIQNRARVAAGSNDIAALTAISRELESLERSQHWPYVETSNPAELSTTIETAPRLEVNQGNLSSRILGAWLGRAVANTMGKPVEGMTRAEIEIYLRAAGQWPQSGYVPLLDPLPTGVEALHESASIATLGSFTDIPRDDDLDWTVLGLSVLERYGRDVSTTDIAAEWLDALPFTQTFTAERAAYRNLVNGLQPPDTASHQNPYREWIGALIRGDIFGMVNPGHPAEAARLAIVDARLSHVGNGIYGEMWAAALVAAALASATAREAYDVALRVVPTASRLYETLAAVRHLHDSGATATAALDWVDAELNHYGWVHTVNNAALIAIGLLWGQTFTDCVGLTISGGRDTDSTAATVGSVYGALYGADGIPSDLVGTTHVRLSSSVRGFDKVTITELADRTLAVAEAFRAADQATDDERSNG